jgi:hypothetical protein
MDDVSMRLSQPLDFSFLFVPTTTERGGDADVGFEESVVGSLLYR